MGKNEAVTPGEAQEVSELLAQLEAILRCVPDGVLVYDAGGRIVRSNDAADAIFGYGAAERELTIDERLAASSTSWHREDGTLLTPETSPPLRAARYGETFRDVVLMIRRDGRERWLSLSAAPLRVRGVQVGAVVSVTDTTDRKRREGNQSLLAAMADDFARLTSEEEITRAVGGRLAAHLAITTCTVADFAGGTATIRSAFSSPGAVVAEGTLKVADYLDDELQAAARAGTTVVVGDTRDDARVDAGRYEAMGVRAGIIVPFRIGGEWRHSFAVGTPEPRDWREDEVQLVEEVAARFFPRIERARAEEALRESEERFRLLADAMPQIVCVLRPDGAPEYVNPSWTAFSGGDLAATRQAGWERVLHPEDLEAAGACLRRVLKALAPCDVELRYRRADGAFRWFLGRLAPVVEGGRVVRLVGAAMDIEDRRRAEAEARSLAQFPTENPNPVIRASTDGSLLYCNAPGLAFLRALGWDDGAPLPEPLLQLVRRVPLRGAIQDHEVTSTDGRTWALTLSASAGEAHVNLFGRDVTTLHEARRAAERALEQTERLLDELRRSEERYRSLFDSMDEGFCIIEVLFEGERATDYRFLEVNPAFEKHTGLRDAAGRRMRELVPDHDAHWFEIYGRVALTGEPARFENTARAMGRVFDVNAFRVGPPEQRRVAVLFNDITERDRADEAQREANERLREADRRKDEFLGMLSHELRNPLAPIRNSLFILDRADPNGEQARRAREVASRQVAHLTRLVDDLLDVTRIARGKVELRRSELDLAALARRAAEDHRGLMQDRRLDLSIELPDEPILVEGDETRLAQVLGNLLHNAAKFTHGGGRVTLAVRAEGGNAVVRVGDTGAGIEPEMSEAIFEPFTQGKQTLARSEGGLGLGLALVKGLVALHGGEVAALSAGRGQGTEFVVTVPLAGARSSTVPAPVAARPAPAGRSRRRVLVIDDNRDAADSLAQLVSMFGHSAEVAYDAFAGLARAAEDVPDVVLCDIGLPGMDGYEVARRLRALTADRPIRLVAVSGYAQHEDVTRAIEAGFDAHLAKPADLERLAELLG